MATTWSGVLARNVHHPIGQSCFAAALAQLYSRRHPEAVTGRTTNDDYNATKLSCLARAVPVWKCSLPHHGRLSHKRYPQHRQTVATATLHVCVHNNAWSRGHKDHERRP